MMQIFGLQWDTVGPLPFAAELHAYYVNGQFATRPPVYGPGRIWIDVLGNAPHFAFWRDIEPGNGDPSSFGGWLDQRHAAGFGWGGGYCDRTDLPAMIESAGSRPWSLWLATLDGSLEAPPLPPHVTLCAVQAFPRQMLGFNADLSVVVDELYWHNHRAAG